MNYKRFFKYKPKFTVCVVFVVILQTVSCTDYLNVVPENVAVIEDAFSTRDNAERFLNTLYGYLPPLSSINNPALSAGDEIVVNDNVSRDWPGRAISRGGQSVVSPRLGYWGSGSVQNLFVALRDCNIFLENIDLPFDLQELEKTRWIAEAKFLKAYYHFYLMRMYGPMPIIDENIEVSDGIDAVRVSRASVDDVTEHIIQLLDEAILDLPLVIENVGLELGRITAPVAAGLKARVLATVASPLFNGNSDYSGFLNAEGEQLINSTFDISKWERAEQACKEAIEMAESAGHQLYMFDESGTWSDIGRVKLSIRGSMAERWNDEIIWGASGRSITGGFQSWAQAKINPALTAESRETTQSYWSPSLNVAEMFYSENGVPIEEDVNYDYSNRYDVMAADATQESNISSGFETAILNMNREPRFYASLGFDGGLWLGHGQKNDDSPLVVYGKAGERAGRLDNNRWSLSGYWAKKMVHYESVQNAPNAGWNARSYPFPVIRLADLYLLYAECLNEVGKTTEAYTWIDIVRARAGLDGVVNSWANASSNPSKPTTQNGFREIVQQERLIELIFEGQRFWDLRRWKRASEFLNQDILAWNVEGKTTQDYYNVIVVGKFRFLSRDYLWPISENDIVANDKLIQNPGW